MKTKRRDHVERWRRKKKRECECCRETFPGHEVSADSRMCESCEQSHEYCSICDEWFGDHSECRHLRWVDDGVGICGCGSSYRAEDHREDFMTLLSLLEPLEIVTRTWNGAKERYDGETREPLLPEIRRHIAANNFWTMRHSYDYYLCRGEHSFDPIYVLRDQQFREWDGEAREGIRDDSMGFAWLCSLDDKSVAANALTVKWIDEYPEAIKLIREQNRRDELWSQICVLVGDDEQRGDDMRRRFGAGTKPEFDSLPIEKIEVVLKEVTA